MHEKHLTWELDKWQLLFSQILKKTHELVKRDLDLESNNLGFQFLICKIRGL